MLTISQFMSDGAGAGPGLKGDGSQNAGDEASTGDATPGSGAVGAAPSTSHNAAGRVGGMGAGNTDRAPFVVAGLVMFFSLTGALLL